MSPLNEGMRVSDYLRGTLRTIDGLALAITILISVLYLVDILSGLHILPRRASDSTEKAVVLFAVWPLLGFLFLVRFRQLRGKPHPIAVWLRAAACFGVFFLINFWPAAARGIGPI